MSEMYRPRTSVSRAARRHGPDLIDSFSKPMLKELTEDGAYAADVHLNYEGEFRLKVSAAGSFSIRGTNLGRATAQLNVRILSIKGNLRIKINKPPSNRIWWCFSEPPQIVMHVEPILASRRMQLNALTRVIEKQIRDGIAEACVMPYCDDIPFFDTSNLRPRGGIFDSFGKKRGQDGVPISTDMGAEGLEPKPVSKDDAKKSIDTPTRRRSTSLSAVPPSMAAEALDPSARSSQESERDWVSKTDRSPMDAASTSSLAKSLSGGTKKWFAGRASSGDTYGSGTTTPVSAISKTEFVPDSNVAQLQASSTRPSVEEANAHRQLAHPDTGSFNPAEPTRGKQISDHRPLEEKSIKYDLSNARLANRPIVSAPSVGEIGASTQPISEAITSSEAKPGSLMETIRTRAKDKEALQTSVNQAKDAMRKWGTNWAAKRNLPLPVLPRPAEVPTGSRTPTPADVRQTPTAAASAAHRTAEVRGVDIPRGGLSLQERLANATQLATSPDRKTRLSTESELPSFGGRLSQSLDDDDVPLSRQLGPSVDKRQSSTHKAKVEGALAPKMPKRPPPMDQAESVAKRTTAFEAAPPPLPPRASHMDELPSTAQPVDMPADTSSASSLIPKKATIDNVAAVEPPQLPSRPTVQNHAIPESEAAIDASPPKDHTSAQTAALPRAEEVLKGVIESENTVKQI